MISGQCVDFKMGLKSIDVSRKMGRVFNSRFLMKKGIVG